MFDWALCGLLVLVCVPGLIVSTPRLVATLHSTIEARIRPGQTRPSRRVLVAVSLVQNLVIVILAAATGTALAPRVGLQTPVFDAVVSRHSLWPAVAPHILPTLVVGTAGALLFVAAYYRLVRPRLDRQTVDRLEHLRMSLGPWGRVLYGGVVEEVISRWGLMSLLVWLGARLSGSLSSALVWAAIVVTGVLFGLGHLPSHLAAGCRKTPVFLVAMIGLNVWASLIFGWLFWQHGLLAAMSGHMLLHVVWLPFEGRHVRPTGTP